MFDVIDGERKRKECSCFFSCVVLRQESDDITPPPECVESVKAFACLAMKSTEQKNVLKFMALKNCSEAVGWGGGQCGSDCT